MLYRQGDVMLRRVDALPGDFKADGVTKTNLMVAEGEVTGHSHVLEGEVKEFMDELERRFVELSAETPLTHQEHSTIAVPPGLYEIVRQREYAPEVGEVRVLD